MGDSELVRYAVVDRVATVTLDSPSNRNALSAQLRAELRRVRTDIDQRSDVRLVVLRHTGSVFSAGLDLHEVLADGAGPALREVAEILEWMTSAPQPVVCAIDGSARAGALGLLAAADVVIATPSSSFGLPEVRVGLIAALVAGPLRTRLSAASLRALLLTGEVFDSATALRVGLVDRVAADSLQSEVYMVVEELLAGAPSAQAQIKTLFAGSDPASRPLSELVALSEARFGSDDAREGVAAWQQRRKPRWAPG